MVVVVEDAVYLITVISLVKGSENQKTVENGSKKKKKKRQK